MLNQDETPLLYSLVFGEGVVNDATSVVLFNAIQSFDLSHINSSTAMQFVGNFLYLFISSTVLGVLVSLVSSVCMFSPVNTVLIFMTLYSFVICRLDYLVHTLLRSSTLAGLQIIVNANNFPDNSQWQIEM